MQLLDIELIGTVAGLLKGKRLRWIQEMALDFYGQWKRPSFHLDHIYNDQRNSIPAHPNAFRDPVTALVIERALNAIKGL